MFSASKGWIYILPLDSLIALMNDFSQSCAQTSDNESNTAKRINLYIISVIRKTAGLFR